MEKKIKKSHHVLLPVPDKLPARKEFSYGMVTKYKPEYTRMIYFLALLGANEMQMAQALDIPHKTLTMWKRRHPELKKVLMDGKIKADAKVAYSLYQAALGYSHEDEVILANKVQEYDEKGRMVKQYTEPLRVKTVKHYPPNVTAALKWLQARQPAVWRENFNVNAHVSVEHKVDLTAFSTEELEVLNKFNILKMNSAGGGTRENIEDISYEEDTESDY